MKITLNELLNDVAGNFGQYYFRHINGKIIIQKRTKQRRVGPAELEKRKRFGELAKQYGKIPKGTKIM